MRLILSLLLAALLVPVFPSALSEGQTDCYTVPAVFSTVSATLNPDDLPPDIPREAAVMTAASYSGASLSVEFNRAVPALSVIQYTDEGDPLIVASAENTASISVENLSTGGMADIVISWNLSENILDSTWSVWEDGSYDFIQSRYSSVSEGAQFAPYSSEVRIIDLDEQMRVLSDTHVLSSDTDSFTLGLDYDTSGKLVRFSCEWARLTDGTLFSVHTSPDQVLSGLSYHSGSADFLAVSDPVGDYLAGDSLVLEAVDYSDSFTAALKKLYPQLPDPDMGYILRQAQISTPTDIADSEQANTLWCIGSGPEDSRSFVPFITGDPLFLYRGSIASLNAEAKDVNGTAPSFAGSIPALPVFKLPDIQ